MCKLKSYGVVDKLLDWIFDFLSNRIKAVKVGRQMSGFVSVKSGVPQGSVLGPVLFLIYINDLVNLFGDILTVKLYADDVKIYSVVDDSVGSDMLQCCLNALHKRSIDWQLQLSIKKRLVLHLGTKNDKFAYSIDDNCLLSVTETKDLGIVIDSKIRFDKHYKQVTTKAHQRAARILWCFKSCDPHLLFRAFKVYVRPLVEYCCRVWAPIYKSDLQSVEAVQSRFTKRLFGFKNLSYQCWLQMLNNAETLELRRLKQDLITIFKFIHGFVDIKLIDFFSFNVNPTHGHALKLNKPVCNNNAREFLIRL
jgi:hypothetical protein